MLEDYLFLVLDDGPAVTYNIWRGTTPGGETLLVANWPSASYSDNSAAPGVTYYYVVQASNACGVSSVSNEVSAMLSCCTRYGSSSLTCSPYVTGADCETEYVAGAACGPTVYTTDGCG